MKLELAIAIQCLISGLFLAWIMSLREKNRALKKELNELRNYLKMKKDMTDMGINLDRR